MPYCGLKSVVYPESVSPKYPFSSIRFCISPAVVPARSTSAKTSFCSSGRMEFFRWISRLSSAFVSFKRSNSSCSTKERFSFVLSSLNRFWVVCNLELRDSISDLTLLTFVPDSSRASFAYFSALYTLSASSYITLLSVTALAERAMKGLVFTISVSFAHATRRRLVTERFADLAAVFSFVATVSAFLPLMDNHCCNNSFSSAVICAFIAIVLALIAVVSPIINPSFVFSTSDNVDELIANFCCSTLNLFISFCTFSKSLRDLLISVTM